MDPLDFLEPEELLRFFRCNKTEMSCFDKPQTFLRLLRDNNLIPEDRYKKVIRMKSKENMKQGLYGVLDWLEEERSEHIMHFWRCAFRDSIMTQYPTLRTFRNSLMDGTFKIYTQLPEKVEQEETNGKKRKESSEEGEREEEQTKMGRKKRKRREQSVCSEKEQASPSTRLTPNQRNNSLKGSFSSPLKKGEKSEIWNWALYNVWLPVTCGEKKGMLNRAKLSKGEKCIVVNKQWFSPSAFERFAGREKSKNWKFTIRCLNTPLGKLIQDGHLKYKRYRRGGVKAKQSLFPSDGLSTVSGGEEDADEEVEEDTEDQSSSTEKESSTDHTDDEGEKEQRAEKEAESSPDNSKTTFKVTCGAAAGTLHKNRFASGTCGKSIRTETNWMTPVEFVKEGSSEPDACWRKDIQWEGNPLGVLIKKNGLNIHSVTCKCSLCRPNKDDLENQKNDDECCVCSSAKEEDLVVCDKCPRSFHQTCHLPPVDDTILGDDEPWLCTFCVFRNTQEWRYSDELCKRPLSSHTSQHMLECQYLLLSLYDADEEQIFATNPNLYVKGYSNVIKIPMWLGKVAEKLQKNKYQTVGEFVSDLQLIFTNCASFNRDNAEFYTKGARLKEFFEEELKNIFSIQEETVEG
ncbi:hypothetical protein LDENG_00071820 [Lucifuga dentata]|nr:hypothetical protein LDENG_00071820 [Lucifuga dentata]